jgi:serine/threonine protein phosphatase PrpC
MVLGNTRFFIIRDGKIIHKTRDHSFVGELMARGQINERQALMNPNRNVVTTSLYNYAPDLEEGFELKPGDICIGFDDGMELSDAEIIAETKGCTGPNAAEKITRNLFSKMKERNEVGSYTYQPAGGGRPVLMEAPRDNMTVAVYIHD